MKVIPRSFLIMCILLVGSGLSACGQSGDLYLPPSNSASQIQEQ